MRVGDPGAGGLTLTIYLLISPRHRSSLPYTLFTPFSSWRYHKELRLWLTKEAGTEPTQKTQSFERGSYMYVLGVGKVEECRGEG